MENYIPDYVSDSESNTETDTTDTTPRKRKKMQIIDWIKEQSFSDKDSALDYIKRENTWSYQCQYNDSYGNIIARYRCNKVKFRGPQCSAVRRIIYKSSTDDICLYRSSADHNHEEILSKNTPTFLPNVKQEIREIFAQDHNIRPKNVLAILREKEITLPTYSQVSNFLNMLRLKEFGPTNISLDQLEKLLIKHSKIPDDDENSFVIDYDISYEDPIDFKFFVSSKALLKNAMKTEHLHADSNHKLIWQDFPVFVIGTTDRHRAFHCCGMAVCSNGALNDFTFIFQALKKGIQNSCEGHYKPKILIADANEGITNGFQQVFGNDTLIIMCWSHMHKKITKKLDELVLDKKTRHDILNDIGCLQLSKNAFIFLDALNLFITKWENKVPNFIDYFKEDWVNQNCNWYEAACNFVPCNNNALENFIKVIKEERVLREKLPLTRFLMTTMNYLSEYARKYNSDQIIFQDSANITLDIWTQAYNWAKANKKITFNNIESSDYKHFKVPGKNVKDIKYARESFKTFHDFKEVNFEYYNVLLLANSNYLKGECDCAHFLQCFTCKHLVGLAIRLKIVVPPPEVKNAH